MPKGQFISYSKAERDWLRDNCTMVIGEYHRAFNARFGRDVAAKNLHAMRKRNGWNTGRTGQFTKGQAPHNKGVPCEPGRGGRHPNARKTQFQPGSMNGRAGDRYKPIGTERISEDGYRERKVHDDKASRRWQLVHRLNWEAANGPIPDGHALKCLGDKLNTDPSNWALIPRAILPRLAGGNRHNRKLAYDDAPDELKPTILAAAQLEHKARSLRRGDHP